MQKITSLFQIFQMATLRNPPAALLPLGDPPTGDLE